MHDYECKELGFQISYRREPNGATVNFYSDKFNYFTGIELHWFERILGNKPSVIIYPGTLKEMNESTILWNCMEEVKEDTRVLDLAFRFNEIPNVLFSFIFGEKKSVKLIIKIADGKTSTYRVDELNF